LLEQEFLLIRAEIFLPFTQTAINVVITCPD
jgi:hypothetical protein